MNSAKIVFKLKLTFAIAYSIQAYNALYFRSTRMKVCDTSITNVKEFFGRKANNSCIKYQ